MVADMLRRTIRVQVLRHNETGLLLARSDDLHGLLLHAHTLDEIQQRLPVVIRDLLEADGHQVDDVTTEADDRLARTGFGLPAFIASAALRDGHVA